MRMPRLMSTRLVVTSSPSTTMPGVTNIALPHLSIVSVVVIAHIRVLERAPAAEQNTASADFFVTRQRFVEEVEQIVMQRHDTSS